MCATHGVLSHDNTLQHGGGMYTVGTSSVVVDNCIFEVRDQSCMLLRRTPMPARMAV